MLILIIFCVILLLFCPTKLDCFKPFKHHLISNCHFIFSKVIKLIKRKLAKETREQKLAKTAWEKDYILQPAQSMSLFYEYLEMGKAVFEMHVKFLIY